MMIKGLYETHLFVENLERSIDFYTQILGLKQGNYVEQKRAAFLWIGKEKQSFLGLWEKPKSKIDLRHFAFESDPEWVLNEAVDFLKSNKLNPYNVLRDGAQRPLVYAWVPGVSIYFEDLDGHELEFIGVLPDNPIPGTEQLIIPYDEWLKLKEKYSQT